MNVHRSFLIFDKNKKTDYIFAFWDLKFKTQCQRIFGFVNIKFHLKHFFRNTNSQIMKIN